MIIQRPALWLPSYSQGYARSAAEAVYPGLWDGLVGAWYPSLGPTGETLRDVSGRNQHGTMSGMDAATDWVNTPYGPSLEFDGGTQYIGSITLGNVLDGMPVSVWTLCRWDDLGSGYPRIIGRTYNGQFCTYISANGMGFAMNNAGGTYDASEWNASLNASTWYSLVWTWDGATLAGYVDGILHGTDTPGATGMLDAWAGETRIGNRVDGNNRGWDGLIAGVVLWSRALTPNEIQLLYRDPHAIMRPMQRMVVGTTGEAPAAGAARALVGRSLASRSALLGGLVP